MKNSIWHNFSTAEFLQQDDPIIYTCDNNNYGFARNGRTLGQVTNGKYCYVRDLFDYIEKLQRALNFARNSIALMPEEIDETDPVLFLRTVSQTTARVLKKIEDILK